MNKALVNGDFDLILSLGQVVPHEVIGMANYSKNIFVGTGGAEGINRSHYLGAVYGMERIMGRTDSPVRAVLDYAEEHFAKDLPLVYALTVVGRNAEGEMKPMGLFVGDDRSCYERPHSPRLLQMVPGPLKKWSSTSSEEFRTTWLGNKAIYRTRIAIADKGDSSSSPLPLQASVNEIDQLIRKYGYKGTPKFSDVDRKRI